MMFPGLAQRPGVTLGVLALLMWVEPILARGPRMSEAEQRQFEQQQVEQAAQACKMSDDKAFFGLMVQSEAVRRRFTAPTVAYSEIDARGLAHRMPIARDAYDRFPLRVVDFRWRSASPLNPGDNQEHVVTKITTEPSGRLVVEWTRVHYRAPFVGEDNLGTPYDLDGRRYNPARPGHGQLLLLRVEDCWQLAADTRRTSR